MDLLLTKESLESLKKAIETAPEQETKPELEAIVKAFRTELNRKRKRRSSFDSLAKSFEQSGYEISAATLRTYLGKANVEAAKEVILKNRKNYVERWEKGDNSKELSQEIKKALEVKDILVSLRFVERLLQKLVKPLVEETQKSQQDLTAPDSYQDLAAHDEANDSSLDDWDDEAENHQEEEGREESEAQASLSLTSEESDERQAPDTKNQEQLAVEAQTEKPKRKLLTVK